jgi:N-methylhydantoinase B
VESLDFDLVSASRSLRVVLDDAEKNFPQLRAICVFDHQKELIDCAGTHPHFANCMQTTLQNAFRYLKPTKEEVLICNDPMSGQPSVGDFGLFYPIFASNNEPQAYVGISFFAPAWLKPMSEKLYSSCDEEGFRIPPSPLFTAQSLNQEIVAYLSQSGTPTTEIADELKKFLSLIQNLSQNVQKWIQFYAPGMASNKFFAKIKNQSEWALRTALKSLPDGEFEFSDYLDHDTTEKHAAQVHPRVRAHVLRRDPRSCFRASRKYFIGTHNMPKHSPSSLTRLL